jgi:hypothetical protein
MSLSSSSSSKSISPKPFSFKLSKSPSLSPSVPIDYSMSSYKYTSISNALKTKLRKVREKIREDNDVYISQEHKKACYHYQKYKELLKTTKQKETKIKFEYLKDYSNYGDLQDNFLEVLNSDENYHFTNHTYDYVINYNELNKKFVNRLDKYINVDILNDLFKEQSDFIQSLNMRELSNLKSYVDDGNIYIQRWINKQFNISNIYINYNKSIFLYFQLLDYFTLNPIFNGINSNYNNPILFFNFIKDNYRNFPLEIYEYSINLYIKELNEIFKKAPRTKEVIYIYSYSSDNYIAKKVAKNKSLGYYVSDNFITGSIFPNKLLGMLASPEDLIYEIKIEKDIPLIFIKGIVNDNYSNDEIILPMKSTFYIEYANKKIKYSYDVKSICAFKELNLTSLICLA